MLQFTSQCIFLVVISVIGFVLALNDVTLAHVSQSINVIWSGAAFALGWKLMDDIPPHNTLPDGRNLFTEGFLQTFRTFCNIMHHYRDGFFMYLLAVVFAEAGANAFTVVSVLYLNETLKMGGAEIGMVMLLTLFATLPGSKLGEFVTKKTNPNTSWKLSMVSFIIFTAAASFVLDSPERKNFAYLWAVFWGISLGWFYPTENVFFAMSLPQGQEAELTGFFIYCTQVIVWFPPMLFTWLNESGVNQKWGLMTINIFFFIAICLLMMIKPWDEVIKDARKIDDNDEERQSQQQEDKA